MRKWLVVLTLIVVIASVSAWFALSPISDPTSMVETPPTEESPSAPTSKPDAPQQLHSISPAKETAAGGTPTNPVQVPKTPTRPTATSQVAFVVEDGYAIAHGDILLGTPDDPTLRQGMAKIEEPEFWDSPEIPFVIDPHLEEPQRLVQAILHIQDKTGLRFITYTDQPDAIVFQKGEAHCASPLGRQGGLQPIRLHARCSWKEIVHEILHSLGHIHEQSRSDRDGFVDILWDNIDEKFRSQFEALPQAFLGPAAHTPFDYKSIMLYDPHTFARDKSQSTMRSKSDTPVAPSTNGLSEGDVQRIKTSFSLDR